MRTHSQFKHLRWALSQKWGNLEATQIIRDYANGYRPPAYRYELRLAFEMRNQYRDLARRGYIKAAS